MLIFTAVRDTKCHSNHGAILHHCRDIASFLCSLIPLILGVLPLYQIAHVGVNCILNYSAVKLFSKYSNLSWYLNARDRQAHSQSDDIP